MKRFETVSRRPEFDKDLKKLSRRFPTLDEDLQHFIDAALYAYHKLNQEIGGICRIPGLSTGAVKVYKARKFACRSLKGKGARSGIRVIYGYFEEKDHMELVEIYYKGEKENEDRERIGKAYGVKPGSRPAWR